jgi:hypothetical protein
MVNDDQQPKEVSTQIGSYSDRVLETPDPALLKHPNRCRTKTRGPRRRRPTPTVDSRLE